MEEDFIEATKKWYGYVGKDHHKDHDCHWYLSRVEKYSYGRPSTEEYWEIKHNGYITEFEEWGNSREEVMQKAIDFINEELSTPSLLEQKQ